jgi:hypothetical protein
MRTSDIIYRYEDILERVARLRAELITEGKDGAAVSLLTTENDLIWQLHEFTRFEKE